MNSREQGFLLLSGKLGDPQRKPLTTAQLRLLSQRAVCLQPQDGDPELTLEHLLSIGLDKELSERILVLLEDKLQLDAYLEEANKNGCVPITRASSQYPLLLRKRLSCDAPGCLWVKGNTDILKKPAISLVGSRSLNAQNRKFAREVGAQAAKQGYALVSGNARGADSAAQIACLEAGGCVISIVADSLAEHPLENNILYVSEEDFDEPFSIPRALHRNFAIHAWGEITFVAQCTLEKGGTWHGSVQNLRKRWSPLFCFSDGSPAVSELERMGAVLTGLEPLEDFHNFADRQITFL